MANVKITDLAALTSPETTDVLPIVDIDIDVTKKVSVGEIVGKISGDVTVGTDGTAAITGGVIVDADVKSDAAIAGTKINPDFGSQTIETTGVFSADSGAEATPSITFTGDINTGIYRPDADQLGLVAGGTEHVRITSDGKVGIRAKNPQATLTCKGGPLVNDNVYFPAGNLIGHFFSDIGDSELITFGNLSLDSSTFTLAFVPRRASSIGAQNGWYQKIDSTASAGAWLELGTLTRAASGAAPETPRILISPGGSVGIGISPTYQLQLQADSAGKPSTNTWTIVSDERIKEDIELADLDICYDAIKNIPLKRFKWKDEVYTEEQVPDRHKLGWIAQDVESVFPKAVHTHEFKYNQVFEETIIPAVEEELDEDGNIIKPAEPERIQRGELISEDVIDDCRDLNADQLYAAMYGAIQKLMQKVELLETEVSILKNG